MVAHLKEDLKGRKFGKLLVLGHEHGRGWKCQCDCGNTYYAQRFYLTSGRCSSCGCERYSHNKLIIHPKRGNTIQHKDIIGKKYGLLTAIKGIGYKNNHELILCKCDCGKEKAVDYYKLISGHTSSCGDRIHKIKYNLTGRRFGRLLAVRPHLKKGSNGAVWECRCDCGNTIIVPAHNLLVSGIKSCGCWKEERNKRRESRTRLYKIWQNMKNRCLNSNVKGFVNYGGRGIKICDDWMDYWKFKDWAINNGYTNNLTIERINVNGNYCPENCKWITLSEQTLNKRNSVLYDYKGKTITLVELSKITGLKYKSLQYHSHKNNLDVWLARKGY